MPPNPSTAFKRLALPDVLSILKRKIGAPLVCQFLDPPLTPATNILLILPVYFGDVHDAPQRSKTCQLDELTGVDLRVWKCETRWESTVKR